MNIFNYSNKKGSSIQKLEQKIFQRFSKQNRYMSKITLEEPINFWDGMYNGKISNLNG